MKLPEEKFVRGLCAALRILAWVFLIYGVYVSIISSGLLDAVFLLNRWSGVVVLAFFLFVFLSVNLVVKVADIILRIKAKVQA